MLKGLISANEERKENETESHEYKAEKLPRKVRSPEFAQFVAGAKMCSNTLIELCGRIVYSFTTEVTDKCNLDEPEPDSYNPLESTGHEWYYYPVDEFIYQEYSDRQATSLDYLTSSSLNDTTFHGACIQDGNENTQDNDKVEDRGMAWKRLRPSALQSVRKSMYIGALISLLTASFVGSICTLTSYLCYRTILVCRFYKMRYFPEDVQWARAMYDLGASGIYYAFSFVTFLLFFRPYQLKGVKCKLFFACFLVYSVDTVYRVIMQALRKPYYINVLHRLPVYAFYIINVSAQIYILADHFSMRSIKKVSGLICKMTVPNCFSYVVAFIITIFIYPAYGVQTKGGKMLIALFAPFIGVVLKVISRICVHHLWKITHPGYSHVLLAPLYFGSAVMFRALQADLEILQAIAVLGMLHGTAEVIERSTMVAIDHICHMVWKRKRAPWGSFRTPRRERLMADIAIMSMLFESTAIVSVNGFLYLYQYIYLQNNSFLNLLQTFAIYTSVPLLIEWFFTSVSLAIATHYQNMSVMAVWRRRWKRHILVAIVTAVPVAIWTSANLLLLVHGRYKEHPKQLCRVPFSSQSYEE